MDAGTIGFLTLGAIGLVLIAANMCRRNGMTAGKVVAAVKSEAILAAQNDERTPGAILDVLTSIGDWSVENTDMTAAERDAAIDAFTKHLTHKKPKPTAA